MVGHNYDRAAGGNARLIGRSRAQSDAHLGQQILEAESLRRTPHPLVEIEHPVHRRQPGSQTRKLGDA
jgi:hypothetical protein